MLTPELSENQIELLIDLLVHYMDKHSDLTQYEWGEAQSALDILDEWLGVEEGC